MKLSQKLLGLAGLAVADYACCPYDDYGIVDGACGLTEKTPFNVPSGATDDWNNNMCKAWESNVDATYDGNDLGCGANNWGGCGFQRHFAWGSPVALDSVHSSIDMDNTMTDPHLGTGTFTANVQLTRTFGTADTDFTVGGVPFLGGICKLFIPVVAQHIEQVTVSGVHVNGRAQFPATVKSNSDGSNGGETTQLGTAYCFSVVNIAEFKTNANGDIANANVAGSAAQLLDGNTYTGAADIFAGAGSLQRQAGRDIGDFGDAAAAAGAVDQTEMVEGGANFDVVAHFASAYCQTFWTGVDMQLSGDVNNGGSIDYPLTPDNTFSHAHTDLQDKRHNTPNIALKASGNYEDIGGGYLTGNVRWPNFGAWAGYNSFVACANKDTGTIPDNHWLHQGQDRVAVMSVGSADFRSKVDGDCTGTDNWAEYQFNVRQIGKKVTVCGPGELPDTDNDRCTWNWNYNPSNDNRFGSSSGADAEGFFDRNENLDFSVWSRKRRDAVNRNAEAINGQPVNAAAVLAEPVLTFTFKNYDNAAVSATLTQLSHDASSTTGFDISGQAVTIKCANGYTDDATNNQRDLFPTCFVGDEIHLKASYKPDTATSGNRAFISPWFSEVATTNFA